MHHTESEIVKPSLYNRDLSWLSFNERILKEAGKMQVPLLDRINFLAIFSSNLADRFIQPIAQEIIHAKSGLPASMIIKVNNLEEKGMIRKLYEASQAGVRIELIVRSICRLVTCVEGLIENISIRRIVDRYLEHSRVFIFHNNGNVQVYMGSADCMTRNLYNRIEVCFPILDVRLKIKYKTL